MNQLELGDELAAAAGGLLSALGTAHVRDEVAGQYWRTVRAVKSWQSAREGAVAECTECGQDVPVRFGVSAGSSAANLRALLGSVASGAVTAEEAAGLIEGWPAPAAPSHNFPEED